MRDLLARILENPDVLIDEVFSHLIHSTRNETLRQEIARRFISLLLTDDERAAQYSLPVGCRMRENAKILSPEKLTCGEYVWIGEGSILDASGGLRIGDHTTIGAGTFVWTHSSILANLTHSNASGSPLIRRLPTVIGSGCYIVGPAVINPGVCLGNEVVVLPMSVVTHDVPGRTMVAGAPAKPIGAVDDAYIAALRQSLADSADR